MPCHRFSDSGQPTGFRWQFAGPPGPPMPLTLAIAEAVRAMVFRHAGRRGLMPLPDAFHAGEGTAHGHAHWLIEDADGDGLADHALLFAAAGLPVTLLPVLAEGGELALRLGDGRHLPERGGCWRLEPVWMGPRGPHDLFAPSTLWRSLTPFVTPLWTRRAHGPRAGRDVVAQLRRELARRDLLAPEHIAIEPGQIEVADWVRRSAAAGEGGRRRPPGDAEAAWVAIRFGEPVTGPLALGFGAHFGLGLFGCARSGIEPGG